MANLNHAIASDLGKFDAGKMSDAEVIEFFQALVDTGIVWELHPRFRAAAKQLIESGYIRIGGESVH